MRIVVLIPAVIEMEELHMDQVRHSQEILAQGKNCWRIRKARRVSFLIDGAAYFTAFVKAVEKARKSVYIAGWDINSRVALIRESEEQIERYRLHTFLTSAVRSIEDLEIHILIWDFAMIFALERELFPIFRLGGKNHKRIHFHMDNEHPLGASHHQKIVVVDDSVAFVGGLDLTKVRWDTPEHTADNPLRVDPDGRPYPPFHDVQMAVDGEVAESLGDLFRSRWERATGERLTPPKIDNHDAWPEYLEPDVTMVGVGIARTEPPYRDNPEVREIERLHIDAVISARRYIYIENQYLTSSALRRALAEKLSEEDCPEIVIVLPFASSGWLEESTMDTGRAFVLQRLTEADQGGRLKVYYPVIPGVEPASMTFHSKILIVDDRLVRVGSSNLSNRSMGLDTECDLAVAGLGDEKVADSLAVFRNTLIGEHLGCGAEKVAEAFTRTGSLIDTIEHLRGSSRTLQPLHVEVPQWLEDIVPRTNPADPERPISPERLIKQFLPEEIPASKKIQFLKVGAVAAMLIGVAAAWRWGPLGELIDPGILAQWLGGVNKNPLAPVFVIVSFVLGGFVLLPVTLLLATTALIFEPVLSIIYGLLGALASAMALFMVGRRIGRDSVRQLAGDKVNKISKRLARRGLLTMITLRIVPVAPYSIVNLVIGASHLSLRDFVLGTLLGMAPGILALSFLGDRLTAIIHDPQTENLLLLGSVIVIVVVGFVALRGFLSKQDTSSQKP